MKKLEINLETEFEKVDSILVRKILNILEDYSSSEMSIKENNFVDENYVDSERLINYSFNEEKIKAEYFRKYKYSLKNSNKTEEYQNILTLYGEDEDIQRFKKNLFDYIKEDLQNHPRH